MLRWVNGDGMSTGLFDRHGHASLSTSSTEAEMTRGIEKIRVIARRHRPSIWSEAQIAEESSACDAFRIRADFQME